jgi:uncharacterized protein (DUF849 family)
MRPLPEIMVAPNGARLTKSDHPGVPVTIAEIVATARACAAEGADGIHAHVRDTAQQHLLDAGLYRELLQELHTAIPGFYVQITTEAVGRYSPDQQRALVRALRPEAVSIALREVTADTDEDVTRRFFSDCRESGIGVQHILYDLTDIGLLARLVAGGAVPGEGLKALLVLGRYATGQIATSQDMVGPANELLRHLPGVDWAVCAFGAQETDCLLAARKIGAKARIGFENNRLNRDLTLAATNAERVSELLSAIRSDAHEGGDPHPY